MKRFFLLVVILLLTGSIVYFSVVQPPRPDLLELVPADSIAVVDWESPVHSYQTFIETPFGRQLRNIDRPLILRTIGFRQKEIDQMERVFTIWQQFSESMFFREFFGKRNVLALLPGVDQGQDVPTALSKHLVLLNTSGRKTALLTSFLASVPGVQRLPSLKYQGYTISGYLLQKKYPVYLVTDKELLIAAFAPAPLRHSIDLLLARVIQKGNGMADDSDYLALKQRARGLEDFFLYVNFAPLKSWLRNSIEKNLPAMEENDSSVGDMQRGVQKAVFYHQALQPIHQFTSIVRFEDSLLPPFQKRIYTRPPIENRKLANMPANLVVYFWSNWLDLPAWWQVTRDRASGQDVERADHLAEFVSKHFAMSIENFLNLFGHQVGLDIKEIKSSGFFPVPRICFCIEVKDRGQVEKLLEKMIADLPVHRDMVAGVPVVSVLAAGGLMQPSYALLKEYLLLADGRDQIEDILKPTENMLIRDPDFLELDMGLQQPNNLVFFARTALLIDGLKELASWLGTIIAIRDERAGARSKILIDQAVIPLLDGLTMVKSTAMRSYTGQGEIVLQSTLLINNSDIENE